MQENRIIFPDDFFIREVKPTYHKLQELIEFRGYDQIILDFARVIKCFPDAMVPLVSAIMRYRSEGVAFNVVPPVDHRLRKTFQSSNWLHLLNPVSSEYFTDDRGGNFQATQFLDPKAQHTLVNAILDKILRVATYLDRNHLRALEWSLNEISDNVITHSISDAGGVIQLTLKHRSKEIEFIVADCGIGIPNSLRDGLGVNWSDEIALQEAIREGVTRGTGQGNGLFGSVRIAIVSRGAFSLNSGRAFLAVSRDGRTIVRTDDLPWPGTSVDCTISFAQPMVLEEALRFDGHAHTPVDFIELQYEEEEGDLRYNLSEEAVSTGSRHVGAEARRKLENLAKVTNAKNVLVDCDGVPLVSSSFADEFFVKLLMNLSEYIHKPKLRLLNLSQINRRIINRSARQRIGRTFDDEGI